uniref:NADH-ubiquinone oxidoreductase chain 4 n=1 Tax=Cucullaea labiata TaxID=142556 RepID=A0A141AX66_9BIVA|nr:NADH dehydrogenase subunit 4 [Cucullaea labiata]
MIVSCQHVLSSCLLVSFFFVDPMSWVLVELSVIICFFCILASMKLYSAGNGVLSFTLCVLISCFFLVLCFTSSSLLWFYWWFESSLIPLLWLIISWGYQPERLQAGKYLMIYTLVSSLPFLGVLAWIYSEACSLFMWGWFMSLSSVMVWGVVLAPFLVKSPMYGVHLWLPKAHVEAPVAGSMLLAGLTLKLGGYGIMRVSESFSFSVSGLSCSLSCGLLWGAVVTAAVCLRQADIKSLVAYSSVSHMGLVVVGILSGSIWGWGGALVLMVGHAFSSSGLFFVAGVIYNSFFSRSLVICKGLLSLCPLFGLWGFSLLAANMAAPLTLNLSGEIMLVVCIINQSMWFFLALVSISLLTAGYSLYFFASSFHGVSSGLGFSWFSLSSCNSFVFFMHIVLVFGGVMVLDLSSVWL